MGDGIRTHHNRSLNPAACASRNWPRAETRRSSSGRCPQSCWKGYVLMFVAGSVTRPPRSTIISDTIESHGAERVAETLSQAFADACLFTNDSTLSLPHPKQELEQIKGRPASGTFALGAATSKRSSSSKKTPSTHRCRASWLLLARRSREHALSTSRCRSASTPRSRRRRCMPRSAESTRPAPRC